MRYGVPGRASRSSQFFLKETSMDKNTAMLMLIVDIAIAALLAADVYISYQNYVRLQHGG